MSDIRYKRVLLKLSGEALMGDGQYGIDPKITDHLAKQVKELLAVGHEVGVVVGGGNIFRGMAGAAGGMERAQADYMGMLATVMNALALQDAFEHNDVPCRVMSAIQMNEICEPYIPPSRHQPPFQGQRRYFCRRFGQSVLYDRHRRGSSCLRDRCRDSD